MLAGLSFAVLALFLGLKHSYDADHLIAVSNILRKVKSLKSAFKVSMSWAVGHMITATIITILLYIFRESLLNNILQHFRKVVGIMLIVMGAASIISMFKIHKHEHEHEKPAHFHTKDNEEDHSHKHMFGIGMIHGFASNDEMLVLFTASLGVMSLGSMLVGVGIFSLGVILGMMAFAFIFTLPLIKINSNKIYKIISGITGVVGISYGIIIIFSIV